jgi:hypothetical protein
MTGHSADDVRETNRCRLAHQMHMFDLFPWHVAGYRIERCVNCGLTKAEIAALNDGPGDAQA